MIVKRQDSLRSRKLELEILRSLDLPVDKAYLVEQEWKSLLRGEKGEKDAAYYIDFDFKDSVNYAVIHDLRLEYDDRVAQIDHLLIGRLLDIYVLETKSYGEKLEIKEDGSFVAHYGKKRFSVPSPIEQNRRHIALLKKLVYDKGLAPTRLGFSLPVEFISCVIVDPKTELIRPKKLDTSNIMHADRFVSWHQKRVETLSSANLLAKAGKVVSEQGLRQFAKRLIGEHKPGNVNYQERFGLVESELRKKTEPQHAGRWSGSKRAAGYYCAECRVNITRAVAKFCFDNKSRFNGRAYCMQCQRNY